MDYLPRFEYLAPTTLPEACSLLHRYGQEARVLAGGTDLLVRMKEREIRPRYLIDLKHLPGLDQIRLEEEGLVLGALTSLSEIEESPLIRENAPLLAQAASTIGAVQTRNRATIGGNICNASPAADMAPALLALEARARLMGLAGERTLPLERFFLGPGLTALQPAEIMTEVLIPPGMLGQSGIFLKYSTRKALDLAIINLAVTIRPNRVKTAIEDIRIAVGAVAPTPLRLRPLEDMLRQRTPEEELLEQVAQRALGLIDPITDLRATAEYRKEMLRVFLKRGIRHIWQEIQGG